MRKIASNIFVALFILYFVSQGNDALAREGCDTLDLLCHMTGKGAKDTKDKIDSNNQDIESAQFQADSEKSDADIRFDKKDDLEQVKQLQAQIRRLHRNNVSLQLTLSRLTGQKDSLEQQITDYQ